jgi:Rho-type GTPase-activating protein 1/2
LDNLKGKYKGELVSLTDERESLLQEIAELRSAREIFLEETTMLNARNEELAQLNAYYVRRIEAASSGFPTPVQEKQSSERQRPALPLRPSHTVQSSFAASSDESVDSTKYAKAQQKPTTGVFKRRGNNKESTGFASAAQDGPIEKPRLKHTFQHVSVLRFLKCDHCGEKLWGGHARCQSTYCVHYPRAAPNFDALFSLPYLGTSPLPTKRSGRLSTTDFPP